SSVSRKVRTQSAERSEPRIEVNIGGSIGRCTICVRSRVIFMGRTLAQGAYLRQGHSTHDRIRPAAPLCETDTSTLDSSVDCRAAGMSFVASPSRACFQQRAQPR